MSIFCNEEIIAAYFGQPEYNEGGDLLVDCYYDMAIHITENYRIILETFNYFISIQKEGVFKIEKTGLIESIKHKGEWIESYDHVDKEDNDNSWTQYEWTLFVGERLVSVEKNENTFNLQFDDFSLQLIPHEKEFERPFYAPHPYCRVYGTERLIKRKCTCGGTGELVVDFVGDYAIRCNKCHIGTSAWPTADGIIDEWNYTEDHFEIGLYPEEMFRLYCHEPVKSISLRTPYKQKENGTFESDSVIIEFSEHTFLIESRYAGKGCRAFSFRNIGGYNDKLFSFRLLATEDNPVEFVEEDNKSSFPFSVLRFKYGDTPFSITAGKVWMTVKFPEFK